MKVEKPFNAKPSFEHFRKFLKRETTEGPVPSIELMVDSEILAEATGGDPVISIMDLANLDLKALTPKDLETIGKLMDLSISFSHTLGADFITMLPFVPLQRTPTQNNKENPYQEGKTRGWQNEHSGMVTNRKEFEEFPWPPVEQINVFPIDYAASKMNPGLKVMVVYLGIFEDIRSLMSYENLALKSIEEPDLVGDILEKLTILAEDCVEKAASHPAVGAIFYADDLGFTNNLMLSPKFLREWYFPRLKRIADVCHKHDKLFLFHSCGQIDSIMNDLIETVGIDGKHSFQDTIEPIEVAYKKYGDRIALLGGVDVDLLARGTTENVRARTRRILEVCAPKGGFAIGSGNSVTNYCKVENYYAMLDETRKWNEEHGYF